MQTTVINITTTYCTQHRKGLELLRPNTLHNQANERDPDPYQKSYQRDIMHHVVSCTDKSSTSQANKSIRTNEKPLHLTPCNHSHLQRTKCYLVSNIIEGYYSHPYKLRMYAHFYNLKHSYYSYQYRLVSLSPNIQLLHK